MAFLNNTAKPEDVQPTKLAESDLEVYSKKGLIPNKDEAPATWSKLISGEVDLNTIQSKYQAVKTQTTAPAQNVFQKAKQPEAPPPITQDSILQDFASKGLIPKQEEAPATWEKLKAGSVTVEDISSKYKSALAQPLPPLATTDSKTNPIAINKDPAPETIVDPKTIASSFGGNIDSMGVNVQLPIGGMEFIDYGSPEANVEVNRQQRMMNQATLSGLSVGAYSPSELPKNADEQVTATVMNVYGNIVSAVAGPLKAGIGLTGKLLSKIPAFVRTEQAAQVLGSTIQELKNVKTVAQAKAFGGLEAKAAGRALFGAQIKKAGASAAVGLAENIPLGLGVGAAKSALQGTKDWKDVLGDSIHESIWFAGMGLAAQPIVGAAAKAIGSGQQKRLAANLRGLAANPEAKALADQGLNPNFIESIKAKNAAEFVGPQSQGDIMAQQALDKMSKLNPKIGIPTQLLAHPELMMEQLGFSARELSNTMFGKNGPLADIAAQNPNLKMLIESGQHAKALDSVQSVMTKMLAENPSAKDYAMAPFANNAKSLNQVLTNRITDTVKNPERFPELAKNVFNYLDEPTAENAALLQGKENAPRQFFKKLKSEEVKFTDSRLKPQEVDSIVHNSFKDVLGSIAGEKIPQKIFGKLVETDSILKTALTFNKELNRRFIQAGMQNPYAIDSMFMKAKPELAPGIESTTNLTRLSREHQIALDTRRELSLAKVDLETQLKTVTDPDVKAGIQFQLNTLKDQSQSLNQTISTQAKDIRGHTNALKGYAPEQLQEINDFVNQIYVPNRGGNTFRAEIQKKMAENVAKKQEGLGEFGQSIVDTESKLIEANVTPPPAAKVKGKIENSSQFQAKFGDKDNPYYIAADSELADMMHAFQTSGTDISKDMAARQSFPFGLNILNMRRNLQKEFGPNNVFEKVIKRAEDANVAIKLQTQKFSDMIDGLGIKGKSVESGWLQRIAEKDTLKTSEEFRALKPEAQERVLNAVPVIKKYYSDFIDVLNAKMRANNLPEINKRDDFVTHFSQVATGLPGMMEKLKAGATDVVDFSKGGKMGYWSDGHFDATRTFFRSEKARSGGEYVNDAITGMKLYMGPALERIHYADLIRQVDVAKQFAPQNLRDFLQTFKDQHLLRVPNEIDAKSTGFLLKASKWFTNRLGSGAILGNANVLLQQVTSMGSSGGLGGLHATKALGQLVGKEGDEIWALSSNRSLRDSLHMEVDRTEALLKSGYASKAVQTAKGASEFYTHFLESAMQKFDSIAAKHSFLTGYSRAQQAGLSKSEAVKFADKWTEMVQSNPTRLGQPEFYQSTTVKPVVQFTSFVNNLAGTILNDIPTIARTEGSARAVSMLIKTYAGMTLTNDVMNKAGMPAPFDLLKMIPFLNNYRYGVQGVIGTALSGVVAGYGKITGDKRMEKEYTRKALRSGAALIGPGGAQAFKTYDVYTRKQGTDLFGNKKKGGGKEYTGKDSKRYAKDLVFGYTDPDKINKKVDKKSLDYKGKQIFRKLVRDNL